MNKAFHSTSISDRQQFGTNQMFIISLYNATKLIKEKKVSNDTCSNLDKSHESVLIREYTQEYILYDSIYVKSKIGRIIRSGRNENGD